MPSTKGSSKNAGSVSCPFWKISTAARESIILESVLEECLNTILAIWAREVQGKETAYKCLHNGGVPPIGYKVDESEKYHVDPIESKWIIKAYEMKASGRSYINRGLFEWDRREDQTWLVYQNSFHDLFKNEKYKKAFMYIIGQLRRQPGSGTNHLNKSDEDIIPHRGGIPRIVSDRLWNEVNMQMKR